MSSSCGVKSNRTRPRRGTSSASAAWDTDSTTKRHQYNTQPKFWAHNASVNWGHGGDDNANNLGNSFNDGGAGHRHWLGTTERPGRSGPAGRPPDGDGGRGPEGGQRAGQDDRRAARRRAGHGPD